MKTLDEAFLHTLKDIYWAEGALYKALPKVIRSVGNAELKLLFEAHHEETKGHAEILKEVFASIGEKASGEKCDAMAGLLKECDGLIEEASGHALDVALIGAAQAIEHYEIARYGTLREWAKVLDHVQAHKLLSQILDEEKAANSKLTALAVMAVNEAGASRKVAKDGDKSSGAKADAKKPASRDEGKSSKSDDAKSAKSDEGKSKSDDGKSKSDEGKSAKSKS